MRLLTFVIVLIYGAVIGVVLARLVAQAPSLDVALATLRVRTLSAWRDLATWSTTFGFAFCAGLIEGFLWRRKQVFAGFYQTVFVSSVPVFLVIVMTAVTLATAGAYPLVFLGSLVGLSFCLGLALLAGRPLVR
jgi:hypothetical protein